MTAILDISDVRKTYGSYAALKGVSLSVNQGEFIALVGPSGCGKTTLLKQIAGFEDPDSGHIAIAGADMAGVPAAKRPTSMVFQKLALFPHMTIAENIGFPLKLRQKSPTEIKKRVGEMIELMQLKTEYLTRYPRQLSGGEQQRVALARSMVSEPKLLLLDEPLSALDVKLKKVLQAELKRLHRSVGVTFVHVTHDLEEAMMLADRICVMRDGAILQLGTPGDIYYRPAGSFVAGFIGETNLVPITVTKRGEVGIDYRSADVSDADGRIAARLVAGNVGEGAAQLMLRPELLRVLPPGETADGVIEAEVVEMFGKGGTVQYRARSASGLALVVEIPGTSSLPMRIGDKVRLGFAKKDIYVFRAEA
ncbi:ABC transporter ATP-binding protein [Taklimakanibacter lacteus]|uniref:ABC transporter ATP-binding protein n=1 Tax=Taklimakanibacter lacteus TaxID=2268456 RepID=UPI0013C532D4